MKSHKLTEIEVNGWLWVLKDASVLDGWFDDFHKHMKENAVKSNDLRTVFRVEVNGERYFVKYDSPNRNIAKIKAFLRSKVKSEFDAAMLLEQHGFPVIDHIGWGQKGSEGMLISRELANSYNARDYWFEEIAEKGKDKKGFLSNFIPFLKTFFKSGLYHPDFHLGNLMIIPKTFHFTFVDPYGVKKPDKISRDQLLKMAAIFGSMRGEFSDYDIINLLVATNVAANEEEASAMWLKMLKGLKLGIDKLWEKRKTQILNGSRKKYGQIFDKGNGIRRHLRTSLGGHPFELPESLDDLDQFMQMIKLDRKEAEKMWLLSFRLQFLRILHPRFLLWEEKKSDKNILVIEHIEESCNKASINKIEEFILRCEMAGYIVDYEDVCLSANNQLFINDINNIIKIC